MKKIITIIFMISTMLGCSTDNTLKSKIETMLMPDFRYWKTVNEEEKKPFIVINEEVRKVIKKHNYGGIILFSQNLQNNEQTAKLIYELQKASKNPMFIAIDQEGGIVARLNQGTRFPGNMALGATKDKNNAYLVGQAIGRELSVLGINTNFAPVLDVNVNPRNPVIGLRSFGESPEMVADMGVELIKGLRSENIISTAKHFPGHGDVETDTHIGLAVVNKNLEELEKVEFYPFKKAIENNVDMIMTAHVQLPQIEKNIIVSKNGEEILLPSTISKIVLTDILRNKLGFKGIIVTDALQGMKAITDNISEYEALKMSINAGADILLMPVDLYSLEDVKKLDNLVDKLVEAVKKGEIKEETIDKAYNRIITLKKEKNIVKPKINLEKINEVVGSSENKKLERDLALSAITIVKNNKLKKIEKLLVMGNSKYQKGITDFAINRLRNENKISNMVYDFLVYDEETTKEEIENIAKNYDTVIVYGSMNDEEALSNENYRTKIPNYVGNIKGIQKIFISINKPYDVSNHINYDKILIAYGYNGIDPTETDIANKSFGPNIPASIEAVLLGIDTNGKLPVSIPKIENGKITNKIYCERVK
ncbi:glycoside hydrolase family 3 protein [Oceanivirga salmonicida]|uniref:glycoside hydrolase family 3 protein n=1 Tax=Oceanivirga salmonicida TaxID=1769291 RepID=UPI000832B00D|nr:glycoside hydrolase family 3 N-terminal domain-containing protein [Oceanivirga salmonicida]